MVLFLGVVVESSPLHGQTMAAFTGGSYLIMLNCIAFAVRDWKNRVWLGLATFGLVFIMVPMQSDNGVLFPKMVVKALGLGNLHATSIALSGLECATLAPYGVDCDAKKDTSIGITNVNVLNRLGSTVLVELQVQRTAEAVTVPKKAQHGIQASEAVAWSPPRAEFKTLTLPTAAPADAETESRIAVWYPCNPLLLERLRANDPAKADALACVRLSVPKELVLGNTANGPATYVGDFSQYAHVSRVLSARGS